MDDNRSGQLHVLEWRAGRTRTWATIRAFVGDFPSKNPATGVHWMTCWHDGVTGAGAGLACLWLKHSQTRPR